MTGRTIEFKEEKVKGYLDGYIEHWRKRREQGDTMAEFYIDAFQSVRTSLFGKLTPIKDEIEKDEPT